MLSDIMVASMAEGSGKVNALITPEDGMTKDGSDRFYNVHMRCTLRVS